MGVAIVGAKPDPRITLTYPALDSSRHVAFLVMGKEKRKCRRPCRGGVPRLPAARVQPVGRLHWFIDRAAAPRGVDRPCPARPKENRLPPSAVMSSWASRDREGQPSVHWWLNGCSGSSRMPTGFTRPPTSTRCTTASRSPRGSLAVAARGRRLDRQDAQLGQARGDRVFRAEASLPRCPGRRSRRRPPGLPQRGRSPDRPPIATRHEHFMPPAYCTANSPRSRSLDLRKIPSSSPSSRRRARSQR